jgi:hypothetical protein
MKFREKAAYALSSVLLLFPLLYSIEWSVGDWKFWKYQLSLGDSAVFLFLAFVPGVIAIVYHLVTVIDRRDQNRADLTRYYEWRNARTARREHEGAVRKDPQLKGPVSAVAATVLLTAVFLFVAIVTTYAKWRGNALSGIVYSGLGAYTAILYFMVARLYASALSSRFLMASAIGSASAVVMGWVFASIGLTVLGVSPQNFNLATVLFLTGLFHKWAFDALRRRARKLFGQPEPETVELPLNSIKGIDDVHADLLSEYGVSTVQHLATAEPGEISERTMLPFGRIIGWMDQALLISYLDRQILAARALCICAATDLVRIYDLAAAEPTGPMSKLLDSLAEKASMPRGAIDAVALELRHAYTVMLIYALREGKEYAGAGTAESIVPLVAREFSMNYDFVNAQATTQFEIKRRPAQP